MMFAVSVLAITFKTLLQHILIITKFVVLYRKKRSLISYRSTLTAFQQASFSSVFDVLIEINKC